MKAAYLTGPRTVELRNVPEPSAPPGGLVLDVKACGICGSDLRRWKEGPPKGVDGVIPGHEVGGVVVEAGDGPDPVRGRRPPGDCPGCPLRPVLLLQARALQSLRQPAVRGHQPRVPRRTRREARPVRGGPGQRDRAPHARGHVVRGRQPGRAELLGDRLPRSRGHPAGRHRRGHGDRTHRLPAHCRRQGKGGVGDRLGTQRHATIVGREVRAAGGDRPHGR